jgi:hypothetical protein
VSGDIWFLQRNWSSTGGTVTYVMEYLASQVGDPSTSARLSELAEANEAFLDLSDPRHAELVDLIVDALPSHVAGIEDAQHREYLTGVFKDLYRFAREQQDYNSDPTQTTYFTIGPNPARYFRLENLKRRIPDHLAKTDFVRIDVSNYTAEQRAVVRDYVAELADPRVLITGDE